MDNSKNLREEIVSLNAKMEYNTDITDIETVIKDWLAAESKPEDCQDVQFLDPANYLERFGTIFEKQRSFLTKLMAAANNWDGVDILTEFCDYYTHFIQQYHFKRHIDKDIYMCNSPLSIIEHLFYILSKRNGYENHHSIWRELCRQAGNIPSEVDLDEWYNEESMAMVLMVGADLDAAINSFVASNVNHFKVMTLMVQESIRERFVKLIEERFQKKNDKLPEFIIFRNNEDAFKELSNIKKLTGVSIWSENVTAAKNFANSVKLQVRIVWINTHGRLGVGITHLVEADFDRFGYGLSDSESDRLITLSEENSKRFDLFYNGKWHEPDKGKYWVDEAGITHAQATEEDIEKCVAAANDGYKTWRGVKLSERVNIMRGLANRLYADGKSEEAQLVLKWIGAPSLFGCSLSIVRDREAEIITTHQPSGVVFISLKNSVDLLAEMTCACIAGNAVIVVSGQECAPILQYCDMFATCGIPAGVINSLSSDHVQRTLKTLIKNKLVCKGHSDVLESANKHWHDCCSKDSPYYDEMVFKHFTKPRYVWVPCK